MRWTQTPWFYVYVAASSVVVVAAVQLILGDGIDWTVLVAITVGAVVGTYIGRRIRRARQT